MVMRLKTRPNGWMLTEFAVAVGILILVVMPLGYSFLSEVKVCRAYYYRAVAMEVVDGEMEVLAAGEHRRFKRGKHSYVVETEAARNLPGRFELTVEADRLTLEWRPDKRGLGGVVRREVRFR